MASLNKVILIGNLTRDPELRYSQSGTAIAKFGLAVNEKFKQGDQWKEKVNFVDIVAWGKQAENCSEYLSKGRQAAIEGRLSYSTWKTDDGQNRSKLEVVVEKVVFLGGGQGGQRSGGDKEPTGGGPDNSPEVDYDSVPF